jgi:DNA-directed RNA polymerase specialized sigma24 family protein
VGNYFAFRRRSARIRSPASSNRPVTSVAVVAGPAVEAITRGSLQAQAVDASADPIAAEVLSVDAALERLAALDSDQARIVELRFFGGLTVEETAHVMQRSPRTIKREWRLAKAWLFRALQDGK